MNYSRISKNLSKVIQERISLDRIENFLFDLRKFKLVIETPEWWVVMEKFKAFNDYVQKLLNQHFGELTIGIDINFRSDGWTDLKECSFKCVNGRTTFADHNAMIKAGINTPPKLLMFIKLDINLSQRLTKLRAKYIESYGKKGNSIIQLLMWDDKNQVEFILRRLKSKMDPGKTLEALYNLKKQCFKEFEKNWPETMNSIEKVLGHELQHVEQILRSPEEKMGGNKDPFIEGTPDDTTYFNNPYEIDAFAAQLAREMVRKDIDIALLKQKDTLEQILAQVANGGSFKKFFTQFEDENTKKFWRRVYSYYHQLIEKVKANKPQAAKQDKGN